MKDAGENDFGVGEVRASPRTGPAARPARAPPAPPAREETTVEKELSDIRKEIVEARNLVIKNDNLLKNLGADLKALGKKQESFERRQWVSSAVAYLLFAALAGGAAVLGARGWVAQASSETASLREKASGATEAAERARAELAQAKQASAAALAAYQKLDAGSADEREKAALALRAVDRSKLSPLEARALDDRSRAIIERLAEAKLDVGRNAYKRSDFKTAAAELGKALDLWPEHPEGDDMSFYLGAAAAELRDWEKAAPALARFVAKSKEKKNKDYAVLVLAEAQEKTGDPATAEKTLRAAIADYPASEYIPAMRKRLSGLRKKDAAETPAGAQGAAPAPPASTGTP